MLAERGLSPRRSLGQNFLVDHNLVRKLVEASGPPKLALEVGPGTGVLTDALLEAGAEVVACELDRGLATALRERYAGRAGFTLIEGDCLDGKHGLNAEVVSALGGRGFSLVANLPYNAATPLILALACDHPECPAMYVTVQHELALRLSATVGGEDYGPLSIVVTALAEVERLATLPPECFWPRPEVTSAMVAIRRRARPRTDDPRGLAAFCRTIFASRRKQLGSVLGRGLSWPEGISPTARAEQLDVDQILALKRVVGGSGSKGS